MLKIAICISGLPRLYDECFENYINNIILPNKEHKIDIYCHFWDTYGEEINNKTIKLYNPTNFIFETQKKFDLDKFTYIKDINKHLSNNKYGSLQCYCSIDDTIKNLFTQYSSFYSINQSVKLAIDSNINYDIFIRYRTDILLDNPLIFLNIIDNISKNGLYIANGSKTFGWGPFSDVFVVGNSYTIFIFCQIYNDLDDHHKLYLKHIHLIVEESLKKTHNYFIFDITFKLCNKRQKFI